MTSLEAFALRRALPSDISDIVDTQFRAFTDDFVRDVFMGPDTRGGHERLQDRYTTTMREDFSDIWIKVTDEASGTIVAASNWKIHLNSVPKHESDFDSFWLEDDPEKLKRAEAVLDGLVETRKRLMTEPFVQLYICFTDPAYQRRGAGALMLKWGCDVADRLGLPAWVEASLDGCQLYKVFGFENVHISEGDIQGSTMKRPAPAGGVLR